MANLKARKAEGKCESCWQRITDASNLTRPSMWFQGKLYHKDCWNKRFKVTKRAEHKMARTKKSF